MFSDYKHVAELGDDAFNGITRYAYEPFDLTPANLLTVYKLHSGMKLLSMQISKELESGNVSVILNRYINSMFENKWKNIAEAMYDITYDKLSNHEMNEIIRDETQGNDTRTTDVDNTNDTKSVNTETEYNDNTKRNSAIDNTTNTSDNNDFTITENNNSENNTQGIWGFNSTQSVASNESDNRVIDETNETNITRNKNVSISNTEDTVKENNQRNNTKRDTVHSNELTKETEDVNRVTQRDTSKDRSGYYLKTPGEILQQEIEYRKNLFLDIILCDIDSIITLLVY